MTTSIIIIALLIYISIKNNLKGKQKKVTIRSIVLLPILLLYYIYTVACTMHSISIFSISIYLIAIIIGGIIGLYRSKLYSFVSLDGDVFYSKHVFDSFALIALLIIDTLLRFIFQKYDFSLFNMINLALIVLAGASIITRRFIIFTKYNKLKGNL